MKKLNERARADPRTGDGGEIERIIGVSRYDLRPDLSHVFG